MGRVSAIRLDGKGHPRRIFTDLSVRVEKLRAEGIVPGLGTILVGDDPGSHSYVKGKHNDCARIGVESIRRDLPADITQQLDDAIDGLNADPACTGYIVQLPLPKHLDENAALERIDPDKDADGLHPINLGRLVLGKNRRCPAPRGVIHLLRRYDIPLDGARVAVGRPRRHHRQADRVAADPPQRERDRHPLPHRHPGPGCRGVAGRYRRRRGGSRAPDHRRHDQTGAAVIDVGVSRNEQGLVGDVAPPTCGTWPGPSRPIPVGRAVDQGVPAGECRRTGRSATRRTPMTSPTPDASPPDSASPDATLPDSAAPDARPQTPRSRTPQSRKPGHWTRNMSGWARCGSLLVELPYILVLLAALLAAVFVTFDRWRRGVFVLGSALLLGSSYGLCCRRSVPDYLPRSEGVRSVRR